MLNELARSGLLNGRAGLRLSSGLGHNASMQLENRDGQREQKRKRNEQLEQRRKRSGLLERRERRQSELQELRERISQLGRQQRAQRLAWQLELR